MKLLFLLVLLCLVLSILSAPNTVENSKWNVNFNPDGREPKNYFGQWIENGKKHSYFPSPSDWRDESIYQLVTDRFADGNPANNEGTYGGYNLYDVGHRHGGDFKGITNKLDYIKGLGYTAIWISPVFQNQQNSYHGYAQIDFTLLDERFGTLEEFREMVTEAHKRNIKVIVDIVVNHMADLFYFEGYKNKEAPFRLHEGEYNLIWRDPKVTYTDFKIDNTFFPYDKYTDLYNDRGEHIFDGGQGSYWNSDFHHNGDLRNYGDIWENVLGKIYGLMDDLRTTHPRVVDKITAMTKALITSTDIDGIRVDTPMQVPLTFFKKWIPAIKQHAKELGKDNFFVFGEFYCSKERASTMTGRGKASWMHGKEQFIYDDFMFDGGIYYPFYNWFQHAISEQKHNISGLYNLYKADAFDFDWYNPKSKQTEYRNLNFFNNHDQWRLSSKEDGFMKTILGIGLISFWPGIPLFYYGDEQMFRTDGTALDGWSREDMMTSYAWKKLSTPLGDNISSKDNFDMTSDFYKIVQKFTIIRNTYSVLRTCDNIQEKWIQNNNTNGIFAFERYCGKEKILILFNSWKFRLSSNNIITLWEDSILVNILNPTDRIVNKNAGVDYVSLDGYEIKVYIQEKFFREPKYLTVASITPIHDQKLFNDKREIIHIRIVFSEKVSLMSLKSNIYFNNKKIDKFEVNFNEVTFSVYPENGINKILLHDSISNNKNTNKLISNFHSRFLYGTGNSLILNNDMTFMSKSNYRFSQNGKSIFISHLAEGAEKYRVYYKYNTPALSIYEKWTEWKSYKNTSIEELPHNISVKDISYIQLQYYVDNSAAYIIYIKMD